jgi:hypothetical protein
MALRQWSTSASGNASAGTVNWAEGQAPSSVNNSARQLMADIRAEYNVNDWGWVENSATVSVNSQTVFKVANDQTAQFVAGRRVRLAGGSTTNYSTVVSSSFTAETAVTIRKDSGSLSASMSIVALSAVTSAHVPEVTYDENLFILTGANQAYKIVLKTSFARKITAITTICTSGTCTLTGTINATPLGGSANSVSSVEETQAHTSANLMAAGDDLTLTITSNSSAVNRCKYFCECHLCAGRLGMTIVIGGTGGGGPGVPSSTVTYKTTLTDTANKTVGNTYTFSAVDIGTAHEKRLVHVGFYPYSSVHTMTIGGVAAVLVENEENFSLFQASVPTGTTADIIVTAGGSMSRCVLVVWIGYPDNATRRFADSDEQDDVTPIAILVNGNGVVSGGYVLAFGGYPSGLATHTGTWTGVDTPAENVDAQIESATSYAGYSIATTETSASLIFTLTGSISGDKKLVVAAYGAAP